jgi:hypothetical protein
MYVFICSLRGTRGLGQADDEDAGLLLLQLWHCCLARYVLHSLLMKCVELTEMQLPKPRPSLRRRR